MAGKYEDLYGPMINDETFDLTMIERMGALVALQWLDQNPDQVPGRTITESELKDLSHDYYSSARSIDAILSRLNITVVPDPKPTNVERLVEIIRENGYDIRHNGNRSGPVALALELDSRGVKAPGGEDD